MYADCSDWHNSLSMSPIEMANFTDRSDWCTKSPVSRKLADSDKIRHTPQAQLKLVQRVALVFNTLVAAQMRRELYCLNKKAYLVLASQVILLYSEFVRDRLLFLHVGVELLKLLFHIMLRSEIVSKFAYV